MIGGQIVVEPDQRIEPAEGGSAAGVFAARRGGALVGDAVADEVPARRRGEDQLVAVEEDTAYVRLGGGCVGCGMATVTLGQGIEVAILEAVPEVRQVVDVTDHASGTNPYFEAAKK